jgi:hypothetical protein
MHQFILDIVGLGHQRLYQGRDIGDVAVDLAGGIDRRRPGVEADAGS